MEVDAKDMIAIISSQRNVAMDEAAAQAAARIFAERRIAALEKEIADLKAKGD